MKTILFKDCAKLYATNGRVYNFHSDIPYEITGFYSWPGDNLFDFIYDGAKFERVNLDYVNIIS